MCLFPRNIVTPFRRIARNGGQPLTIDVPCGNCAECKRTTRLQWHFRTYYECTECISKGGFIQYDTLTYDNEHLPHISDYCNIDEIGITDFTCFNHEHIRLFLKRLRRQLDYKHKGVTIKYFITSEYGTDDRFTHRPHYHVLFFVYPPLQGKNIHPYKFSRLVSQTWQYGRTDGIPYKPTSYVSHNTFGSTLVHEYNVDYLRCCSYVSKYITKDTDFQTKIDERIELLKTKYDDDNLKKLIRAISMFHRQSHGFGVSYIDNLTAEEYNYIFSNGACRIIDNKKVVVTIPIPLYFKRKLFYTLKKDTITSEVKYYWIPNANGEDYIRKRYYTNINRTADSYRQIISNLSNIDKYNVNKLLGSRTLEDLAIYNMFYKGFSRDLSFLSYYIDSPRMECDLTDNEYNLYDWIENIIKSKYINAKESDSYYPRDKDNDTIDIPNYYDLYTDTTYKYKTNLNKLTFHEYTTTSFHDFEIINKVLESYTHKKSTNKQKYFEYVETMQKRFKYLLKQ